MADIQYDPACVDCRRDAGKDIAGTTWQCTGHIRAERNWLRAKLANVMVEWEHDVEVLTKERNAALKLSEQRGAAYDLMLREVEAVDKGAAAWKRMADELESERDRLRGRLDQFEAYGVPNVAAALDRVPPEVEAAAEALRDELEAMKHRTLIYATLNTRHVRTVLGFLSSARGAKGGPE